MNPMIPTNILFEMLLGFRSKTFHDSSVNPFPCHNMGPVRTENSDAAVGSPPPPVTSKINIFPEISPSNETEEIERYIYQPLQNDWIL